MKRNIICPRNEPALEPVLFAIRRLEEVVERETRLLLDGSDSRPCKYQRQQEPRAARFQQGDGQGGEDRRYTALKSLQPFLDNLRQKLDRNCDAIKLHLRAVTELTGLIRDALETQEADGTYTVRSVRDGQGA